MKKRKIPMRKSVVSGEMKPKKELVRITRSKEGEVALDPTGKLLDYVTHQKARKELFGDGK